MDKMPGVLDLNMVNRPMMTANVQRAHKGEVFTRKGRGFSLGELKKAGIERDQGRKMHLMIDPRRKTVYDFNVDILSKYAIEMRGTLRRTVAATPTAGSRAVAEEEEAVETVEAAR